MGEFLQKAYNKMEVEKMDILKNRSVRKQILITEETSDNLKQVAKFTGMSQNEIINKGLSAYLKRYSKKLTEVSA